MRTVHIYRSARDYFIDGIYWGDDEEGVMLYRVFPAHYGERRTISEGYWNFALYVATIKLAYSKDKTCLNPIYMLL